jgi:hypothetical protein
MNTACLSRNLLIHRQLESIAHLLHGSGILVIVLKGAALVELAPAYMVERLMEDIDLLVHPDDAAGFIALLQQAGYHRVPEDPEAWAHPGQPAHIDVSTALWYLEPPENAAMIARSADWQLRNLPGLCHLPPVDFYVHVLAHAAVHHAAREERWLRDLALLKDVFGEGIDEQTVEEDLKKTGLKTAADCFRYPDRATSITGALYRRIATSSHPQKGHLTRFLCLPLRRKAAYLWQTLFPSADFIRGRYSATTPITILSHRLCRPWYLLHSSLLAVTAIIFAHFGAFRCLLKRKRQDTGW